jgi:hypothetical protein
MDNAVSLVVSATPHRSTLSPHRMNTTPAPNSYRFGLHVHIYLYVAVLALNIAALLVGAKLLHDESSPLGLLIELGLLIVLTNFALWAARRRCSTEGLTCWQGLLLITAYMSIGVGSYSLIVAVPAAIIAMLATIIISIISIFRSDRNFAPRQFRRLIKFYYGHRMYQ